MVRIIPWKLPEVKGGSIGGYTEHGGGSGGDTPVVEDHFDFSGANFKVAGYGGTRIYYNIPQKSYSSGEVATPTGLKVTLSGIETIDVVGVSSIVAVLTCTSDDTHFKVKDTFSLSMDPLTLNVSYRSGTFECVSTMSTYMCTVSITACTFYVYNSNGEIIETEEVTYT